MLPGGERDELAPMPLGILTEHRRERGAGHERIATAGNRDDARRFRFLILERENGFASSRHFDVSYVSEDEVCDLIA